MPGISKIKAINVDYDRVGYSIDDVNNKKFIPESEILKSYWGDNEGYVEYVPLKDGTYLIEQDGVSMGHTDQEGFNKAISNGMKLGADQKKVAEKNDLLNVRNDSGNDLKKVTGNKLYTSDDILKILSLKNEDIQKISGTMSDEEYSNFIVGVENYYDKQIKIMKDMLNGTDGKMGLQELYNQNKDKEVKKQIDQIKQYIESAENNKKSAKYDYLFFLKDYSNYKFNKFTENDYDRLLLDSNVKEGNKDNYVSSQSIDNNIYFSFSAYHKKHPDISPVEYVMMLEKKYPNGGYIVADIGSGIENFYEVQAMVKAFDKSPEFAKAYSYLYEKDAKKANDFFSDCKYELNSLRGQLQAKEFLEQLKSNKDNPNALDIVANELGVTGEGLADGLNSFGNGVFYTFEALGTSLGMCEENRITSVDEYKKMYILNALLSDEQKEKSGLICKDSSGKYVNSDSSSIIDYSTNYSGIFLNRNYTISQGIGNMTPSISLGLLFNPMGSISLGLSAAGNAYHGSMVEGRSYIQSVVYGAASGVTESVTELLYGSIPGLSDVEVNSFLTWCKAAAKEGREEVFQNGIDIIARRIIFGESIKLPTTREEFFNGLKEQVDTFVDGAIISGILNVPRLGFAINNSTKSQSIGPKHMKTQTEIESAGPKHMKAQTENESAGPKHMKVQTEDESAGPKHMKAQTENESAGPKHMKVQTEDESAGPKHMKTQTEVESAGPKHMKTQTEVESAGPKHMKTQTEVESVGPKHMKTQTEAESVGPKHMNVQTEIESIDSEHMQSQTAIDGESNNYIPTITISETIDLNSYFLNNNAKGNALVDRGSIAVQMITPSQSLGAISDDSGYCLHSGLLMRLVEKIYDSESLLDWNSKFFQQVVYEGNFFFARDKLNSVILRMFHTEGHSYIVDYSPKKLNQYQIEQRFKFYSEIAKINESLDDEHKIIALFGYGVERVVDSQLIDTISNNMKSVDVKSSLFDESNNEMSDAVEGTGVIPISVEPIEGIEVKQLPSCDNVIGALPPVGEYVPNNSLSRVNGEVGIEPYVEDGEYEVPKTQKVNPNGVEEIEILPDSVETIEESEVGQLPSGDNVIGALPPAGEYVPNNSLSRVNGEVGIEPYVEEIELIPDSVETIGKNRISQLGEGEKIKGLLKPAEEDFSKSDFDFLEKEIDSLISNIDSGKNDLIDYSKIQNMFLSFISDIESLSDINISFNYSIDELTLDVRKINTVVQSAIDNVLPDVLSSVKSRIYLYADELGFDEYDLNEIANFVFKDISSGHSEFSRNLQDMIFEYCHKLLKAQDMGIDVKITMLKMKNDFSNFISKDLRREIGTQLMKKYDTNENYRWFINKAEGLVQRKFRNLFYEYGDSVYDTRAYRDSVEKMESDLINFRRYYRKILEDCIFDYGMNDYISNCVEQHIEEMMSHYDYSVRKNKQIIEEETSLRKNKQDDMIKSFVENIESLFKEAIESDESVRTNYNNLVLLLHEISNRDNLVIINNDDYGSINLILDNFYRSVNNYYNINSLFSGN